VTITVCKLVSANLIDFTWLEAMIGEARTKKRKNLKGICIDANLVVNLF
jgi:hypothetical protein